MIENRPNILIFFVDQMQADVTRSESQCKMPTLQQFASEGIQFSRAFTPSPHCCPSRATLMTGAYPSRHGVYNNVQTDTAHQFGLNPGVRTFAQDLSDAGYRLSYSGKWHVSNEETPADRGWNEVTPFHIRPPSGLRQWKNRSGETESLNFARESGKITRHGWDDWELQRGIIEGPDGIQETRYFKNAVGPGIEELSRLANEKGPWCLCISTDMSPFDETPRELHELYDPKSIELPPNFYDTMEDKPNIYRRLQQQLWGQLTLEEVRAAMANYYATCTLQDKYFEMILNTLEKTGQADDTLVMFIADHGEYNFAHGLQCMGIPSFREAYHVPIIARWPRGIESPNRTVSEIITLADIAPTLIALSGTTSKDTKTGQSLVPFFKNQKPENWPDAWFSQTKGNEVYYTQRIVMTDDYKFVYNAFDFDELYDLRHDPHELTNLIHPSCYPQPASFEDASLDDLRPMPRIEPALEPVRQEMMARIWEFAFQEEDIIFNPYLPCAIATYGPVVGLQRTRATTALH